MRKNISERQFFIHKSMTRTESRFFATSVLVGWQVGTLLLGSILYSVVVSADALATCRDPKIFSVQGRAFWDYTSDDPKHRWHVRDNYYSHLLPKALSEFKTSKPNLDKVRNELIWTLDRIPNNHQALLLWIKLAKFNPIFSSIDMRERMKGDFRFPPTPQCYFERALVFTNGDPKIYMLYGIYLHTIQQYDAALVQYKEAEKKARNWAELQYNIGLLLFDMQRYEEAAERAIRAEKLGYPLRGLSKKLDTIGRNGPVSKLVPKRDSLSDTD